MLSLEYPPRRTGTAGGSGASALEQMPNLCKKVTLMWKSRELDHFIQKSILDGRDGDRKGFPMEVGAELLFLGELNKIVRAIDLAAKNKIKLGEAYRLIDQGDRVSLAPDGQSPWVDPLSVGSTRQQASDLPRLGTSSSLLRPKAKKRGLLSRLFSIR